jgi:hypothetical protein
MTKAAAKSKMDYNPEMMHDPVIASKVQRTAKHNIPVKYASSSTSGLGAEVKAESNKINFDLTD